VSKIVVCKIIVATDYRHEIGSEGELRNMSWGDDQ